MFAEFPHLQAARTRSRQTLRAIEESLRTIDETDDRIAAVAVAGSLGRLEQTTRSDIDLIVVVRDDAEPAPGVVELVNIRLSALRMSPTKPGGIFSRPFTARQLCDAETLGVIDEDMAVYGVRMHLLLEARPVFGHEAFASLTRGILNRFADVRNGPRDEFLWGPLLDDVIRYHRSLSARYRFIERFEPSRANELQLKAAYSRFVNVAGLLLLLGESLSGEDDPVAWMGRHLIWTPLERIGHLLGRQDAAALRALLSAYDRFLAALDSESSSDSADALIASAGTLRTIVVQYLLNAASRSGLPRSFLEQLLF